MGDAGLHGPGIRRLPQPSLSVAVALGSSGFYCLLYLAMGGEPWDGRVYLVGIGAAAMWIGYARPRAAPWNGVALIVGQFVGWAVCAALREPQSLAWWPSVVLLTIPLFIAPVVASTIVVGAAIGLIRGRRRRAGAS